MRMLSPIIHIVDDDSSFRSAIGELLRVLGYRVALYESAKVLLDKPPLEEPSCILLDVQMADLSGPELQQKLAALGCRIPIVSSPATRTFRQRCGPLRPEPRIS